MHLLHRANWYLVLQRLGPDLRTLDFTTDFDLDFHLDFTMDSLWILDATWLTM